MNFCPNCGSELEKTKKFCVHCGTPIVEEKEIQGSTNHVEKIEEIEIHEVETTSEIKEKEGIHSKKDRRVSKTEQRHIPNKSKKPLSKKKKIVWGLLAGLVICIIGFSIWAKSYESAESVHKRFETAIDKQDEKALTKLVVHEDGTSMKDFEAKAFLQLVKRDGLKNIKSLYTTVQKGKFIGIFDAHKIKVMNQFATYDVMEGLHFTFNGVKLTEKITENETIVYGPFAPGVYQVEAIFTGKYGETSKKATITFADEEQNDTVMDIDLPISLVTFFVNNYEELDTDQAYILINDEKLPLDEAGETKEIGPLLLEGDQKVKVVVTMPWGEVTSEPIVVTNPYMGIYANLLTDEQYKGVLDVLKDFGEQYVQVLADKSTKPLTVANKAVKEDLTDEISNSDFYSGKLNTIKVDRQSISTNQSDKASILLYAEYGFEEAYHELTGKPELLETTRRWTIGLSYNEDKEKWIVGSMDEGPWEAIDPTDELDGTKKLYGPSKQAIANAKQQDLEETIEQFMYDYTAANVDAINYRDYDFVQDYIDEDGPRKKDAMNYIDYADSKDLFEDLVSLELEKVEKVDDHIMKVTVKDTFQIHWPDRSEQKTYRTIVHLKKVDDGYVVNKLIDTTPIQE